MAKDFEVNAIKSLPFNQNKLGSIIHDLESPLTITQFNLDQLYLKASTYHDGELTELLEPAMSGVRAISTMINSIKNKKNYMPYSINHEISSILKVFSNKCKQEGIVLKAALDSDTILYQHKLEFRSIVSNLISNAVKACLQSDKIANYIYISTKTHDGSVKLTVRDNAFGLPISVQEDIRLMNLEENSGLGVVYKNVRDIFKGEISVTTTKGHGTSYDITFT